MKMFRYISCLFLILCLFTTPSFSQHSTSYPLKAEAKITKVGYFPFVGMEQSLYWSSFNYLFTFNKLSDVELKITNTSNKNVYFWAMTCWWEDNLIFDNTFVFGLRWGCDYNFPCLMELKPGESEIFKTTVCINLKCNYTYLCVIDGNKLAATKLGLIIINAFYKKDYSLLYRKKVFNFYEYVKEKKNQVAIIWSNPLNFL